MRELVMPPTAGSRIRQSTTLSPMALSDRLITLAQDAEVAGYPITAEQLVLLAIMIFDEAPRRPH